MHAIIAEIVSHSWNMGPEFAEEQEAKHGTVISAPSKYFSLYHNPLRQIKLLMSTRQCSRYSSGM